MGFLPALIFSPLMMMKMTLSYHAPLMTTDLFYLHALSVPPLVRHDGLAPLFSNRFYATAFFFPTP
jgi:hypothetical protein